MKLYWKCCLIMHHYMRLRVSECLDAFMISKLKKECKINFNIDYFKGAYISAILQRS